MGYLIILFIGLMAAIFFAPFAGGIAGIYFVFRIIIYLFKDTALLKTSNASHEAHAIYKEAISSMPSNN